MQHDDVRMFDPPQHLYFSQNLEVDALFLGACHPYFFNGDLQIVLLPRRLSHDAPLAGAQRGAYRVLVHRSLSGAAAARRAQYDSSLAHLVWTVLPGCTREIWVLQSSKHTATSNLAAISLRSTSRRLFASILQALAS